MGQLNRESSVVVLISADAEWRVVRALFPQTKVIASPLGEWFVTGLEALWNETTASPHFSGQVRFFHGGWGKIAAAASTQYVIDRWK
ncbi:MAG TPA: hypothetical protein VGA03_12395, partial [Anaerolineales bacterium]